MEDIEENVEYSQDVGIGLISTLGIVLVLALMGAYKFWERIKRNLKNPFPLSLDGLRKTISEFLRIRNMDISGSLQLPSMGHHFGAYGYQMAAPFAPTPGPSAAGSVATSSPAYSNPGPGNP